MLTRENPARSWLPASTSFSQLDWFTAVRLLARNSVKDLVSSRVIPRANVSLSGISEVRSADGFSRWFSSGESFLRWSVDPWIESLRGLATRDFERGFVSYRCCTASYIWATTRAYSFSSFPLAMYAKDLPAMACPSRVTRIDLVSPRIAERAKPRIRDCERNNPTVSDSQILNDAISPDHVDPPHCSVSRIKRASLWLNFVAQHYATTAEMIGYVGGSLSLSSLSR